MFSKIQLFDIWVLSNKIAQNNKTQLYFIKLKRKQIWQEVSKWNKYFNLNELNIKIEFSYKK